LFDSIIFFGRGAKLLIRQKIIAVFAIPVGLVFALTLLVVYFTLKTGAENQLEAEMHELVDRYAALVDLNLEKIALIATTTATSISHNPALEEEDVFSQLAENVSHSPLVYGAAMAFDTYGFDKKKELFSPYVYRQGDGVAIMDIGAVDSGKGYDYREWEWWTAPISAETGVWTAPYFDEGAGNIVMSTFSAPFTRNGKLWGVTTVDIDLKALFESIHIPKQKGFEFFIITKSGQYVAHEMPEFILNESIFSQADATGSVELAELGRQMVAGGAGLKKFEDVRSGEPAWFFYAPIPSAQWTFGARISESEALSATNRETAYMAGIFLFSLLLILAYAAFAAGRTVRPLIELKDATKRLALGQDSAALNIRSFDEIGELADDFNVMAGKVREREAALNRSYESLESKVEDRTKELREAEEKIRTSRDNLNAIIENTADGIVTIDSSGVISMINPVAARMFGYETSELVGKNVNILMPSSDRTEHQKYVEESYIHASRIINRPRGLSGLRKDGGNFPLELNVSPMEIHGNKMFIGIIRDITERQKAEDSLRVAKIEAENANLAKSQFLSSMSHELRTPLNSILGFSQIMLEDEDAPLNEDHLHSVSQVYASGQHLLDLINDVLDLARIESEKLDLSIEPVDLPGLLHETVKLIRSQAIERRIIVHDPDFADDQPFVLADYRKLKQVLLNLLSNAVKYNRQDGEVFVLSERRPEGIIRINIRDTGEGIEDKNLPLLFEPFNRLGHENSAIQGTGIGLNITRKLVEAMEGELGVSSTPGQGSTFWVEFREAEKPAQRAEAAAEAFIAQSTFVVGSQEHYKVLYVEDNPANMMLMERIVSKLPQYDLLKAMTGEEGVKIAVEKKPDVILMDISLPGIDGFEALEELQKRGLADEMTIIALSANAMKPDIEKGRNAGFYDYLTKPLNVPHLLETLERAVAEK